MQGVPRGNILLLPNFVNHASRSLPQIGLPGLHQLIAPVVTQVPGDYSATFQIPRSGDLQLSLTPEPRRGRNFPLPHFAPGGSLPVFENQPNRKPLQFLRSPPRDPIVVTQAVAPLLRRYGTMKPIPLLTPQGLHLAFQCQGSKVRVPDLENTSWAGTGK